MGPAEVVPELTAHSVWSGLLSIMSAGGGGKPSAPEKILLLLLLLIVAVNFAHRTV